MFGTKPGYLSVFVCERYREPQMTEFPESSEKHKQVPVRWLKQWPLTLSCLLESTYLSFHYCITNTISEEECACMNAGWGRVQQGLKTNLLGNTMIVQFREKAPEQRSTVLLYKQKNPLLSFARHWSSLFVFTNDEVGVTCQTVFHTHLEK